MRIIKLIQIRWYKNKLKRAYLQYLNNELDCGSALQDYISGDKQEVNHLIGKLKKIDSECTLNEIP